MATFDNKYITGKTLSEILRKFVNQFKSIAFSGKTDDLVDSERI